MIDKLNLYFVVLYSLFLWFTRNLLCICLEEEATYDTEVQLGKERHSLWSHYMPNDSQRNVCKLMNCQQKELQNKENVHLQ